MFFDTALSPYFALKSATAILTASTLLLPERSAYTPDWSLRTASTILSSLIFPPPPPGPPPQAASNAAAVNAAAVPRTFIGSLLQLPGRLMFRFRGIREVPGGDRRPRRCPSTERSAPRRAGSAGRRRWRRTAGSAP